MQNQSSPPPQTQLENDPESTQVFFTGVFSWFDRVIKFKKFRRTRKHIKQGEKLFDLSAAELAKRHLMGPWTFNLYESALAAFPAQVFAIIFNFFSPYEPLPNIPEGVTAYRKAYIQEVYKLAPSVNNLVRPGIIPTILLAASAIIAWGCLRSEDSTRQSRKRCRNAYLYYRWNLLLNASSDWFPIIHNAHHVISTRCPFLHRLRCLDPVA